MSSLLIFYHLQTNKGFPCGSASKESRLIKNDSLCNRASLIAQLVQNSPAMQQTLV